MGKAFFITTMGCQMNEYDSDLMARSLIQSGMHMVEDPEEADLILVNTCTVREKPEQKACSMLGRFSKMKKRRPEVLLGVVGCVAQQMGQGILGRFPMVDLVIGPREIGRLQAIMDDLNAEKGRVVATRLDPEPPRPVQCRGYFKERVSAHISIMVGCNNFCSYCIVPFVRGREVSRSPEEITIEAEHLIAEGIKEITLLGQNVNSYRWIDSQDFDFATLLRELNRLEGLQRIRFTTSHPKDMSPRLIECFKDLDRLCPHIHLPFQAGADSVLQKMRRGYTREEYLDRVDRLRSARPDIAITSDVMVGFPGESESDFEDTMDLVRTVRFDGLFSFKYSDRKGTLSCGMEHKVPEREKARRLSILQDLQKKITLEKNRALEGERMEVLVEGESRREGQFTGRTPTNKIVNFHSDNSCVGKIVKVLIKNGLANSLRADIAPDSRIRNEGI